jgi:hypothetical protein
MRTSFWKTTPWGASRLEIEPEVTRNDRERKGEEAVGVILRSPTEADVRLSWEPPKVVQAVVREAVGLMSEAVLRPHVPVGSGVRNASPGYSKARRVKADSEEVPSIEAAVMVSTEVGVL